MKTAFAKAIALIALCLVASAQAVTIGEKTTLQQDVTRVAVVANRKQHLFWDLVNAGAIAAAADAGVDLQHIGADTAEDQVDVLNQLVADGVKAIAISVIDPTILTPALNAIAKKNTTLITVDADAADSARTAFIAVDNYKAGRMAGEVLRNEALVNGGKVAFFTFTVTGSNVQARLQGAVDGVLGRAPDASRTDSLTTGAEGITENGFTALPYDAGGSNETAISNVALVFEQHPDLGAIIVMTDVTLTLDGLAAIDKLGKVKLVTFDEVPDTLAALELGYIDATVSQNPYEYGMRSVQVLVDLLNGKKPEEEFIEMESTVVRSADAAAFTDALNEKLGRDWGVEEAKERIQASASASSGAVLVSWLASGVACIMAAVLA